jgi:hypothetical protein
LHFRTNFEKDTSSWYSSRRIGEDCSGFKVLVQERQEDAITNGNDDSANGGRILGAHLLGTHAEEIINIFALAIRLISKMRYFPTLRSHQVLVICYRKSNETGFDHIETHLQMWK